jgi:Arc/MetJ-type ribon-helix-helix transcriptional regulator
MSTDRAMTRALRDWLRHEQARQAALRRLADEAAALLDLDRPPAAEAEAPRPRPATRTERSPA